MQVAESVGPAKPKVFIFGPLQIKSLDSWPSLQGTAKSSEFPEREACEPRLESEAGTRWPGHACQGKEPLSDSKQPAQIRKQNVRLVPWCVLITSEDSSSIRYQPDNSDTLDYNPLGALL